VAGDLAARIGSARQSLAEAAREIVHQRLPEEAGGLIGVNAEGQIAIEFNTPGMSRASADSGGKRLIALD
jgi:beta-aspartyl-peptidase (threonine type)